MIFQFTYPVKNFSLQMLHLDPHWTLLNRWKFCRQSVMHMCISEPHFNEQHASFIWVLKQLQQTQEENETCKLFFRLCKKDGQVNYMDQSNNLKHALLSNSKCIITLGSVYSHPTIHVHRNIAKTPFKTSMYHKLPREGKVNNVVAWYHLMD